MKRFIFFGLVLCARFAFSQTNNPYNAAIMKGITGTTHQTEPYAAAGDRAYLIGTQDGNFPDMGDHIKGEMGGLWCPPFKLADGFWVMLKDKTSGKGEWLKKATSFTTYPYGSKLTYKAALSGIDVERFQFCPDGKTGALIKYTLTNNTASAKSLILSFNIKTDIRPVWYTDSIDVDYSDKILSKAGDAYFAAKDSLKSWFMALTSSSPATRQQPGNNIKLPDETIGKGVKYAQDHSLSIKPNSSVSIIFAISGAESEKLAIQASQSMVKSFGALLKEKIGRYNEILNRSNITIPDASLQTVYNWVKINTQWLKRTVPGIGTGLTAGYMEYPWYFGCDNTYALQGVLATGDFKLAKSTLEVLYSKSKEVNGNGRIIHELSTSGKVYNKGNTQETAHFIMCAGTYLKWTGDTAFIRKIYPSIKDGIHWLLVTMDQNKNMFPEGYGIMEVTGLNAELIDVAVYTQQALKSAAEMGVLLKDDKQAKEYAALSEKLKDKINIDYWDEQSKSYCDFYGTSKQALTTLDGARRQLKISESQTHNDLNTEKDLYYKQMQDVINKMPDTTRGWLTNKNWVINTPMEMGIAPRDKAINALNVIKRDNCGPYGPYLSAVEKKYMMTIATGVQAVAECRYGRIDSALWYVNRIAATFNRVLPGSISEMMPDYGCFTQAWTDYGIDIPLISYIFGIKPDAAAHQVTIAPMLPARWKTASLSNQKVGSNVISVDIKETGDQITYIIGQSISSWKITLKVKGDAKFCSVNGKKTVIKNGGVLLNSVKSIVTVGTAKM